MKRILLIDNYDSFTYNLVHYLEALDCEVVVQFNDEIVFEEMDSFDGVVISPGPRLPAEAGRTLEFISAVLGKKPILGVCLGMQALALQLQGGLYNQKVVKHGVQEVIHCKDSVLFSGMPPSIDVGLYHSWAVDDFGDFTVTAWSNSGVVMAFENEDKKVYAVQFHPESILTPQGHLILKNFLTKVNEFNYEDSLYI